MKKGTLIFTFGLYGSLTWPQLDQIDQVPNPKVLLVPSFKPVQVPQGFMTLRYTRSEIKDIVRNPSKWIYDRLRFTPIDPIFFGDDLAYDIAKFHRIPSGRVSATRSPSAEQLTAQLIFAGLRPEQLSERTTRSTARSAVPKIVSGVTATPHRVRTAYKRDSSAMFATDLLSVQELKQIFAQHNIDERKVIEVLVKRNTPVNTASMMEVVRESYPLRQFMAIMASLQHIQASRNREEKSQMWALSRKTESGNKNHEVGSNTTSLDDSRISTQHFLPRLNSKTMKDIHFPTTDEAAAILARYPQKVLDWTLAKDVAQYVGELTGFDPLDLLWLIRIESGVTRKHSVSGNIETGSKPWSGRANVAKGFFQISDTDSLTTRTYRRYGFGPRTTREYVYGTLGDQLLVFFEWLRSNLDDDHPASGADIYLAYNQGAHGYKIFNGLITPKSYVPFARNVLAQAPLIVRELVRRNPAVARQVLANASEAKRTARSQYRPTIASNTKYLSTLV